MTGEWRPFPSLDLATELAEERWPLEPLGVRFEGGLELSVDVLGLCDIGGERCEVEADGMFA